MTDTEKEETFRQQVLANLAVYYDFIKFEDPNLEYDHPEAWQNGYVNGYIAGVDYMVWLVKRIFN